MRWFTLNFWRVTAFLTTLSGSPWVAVKYNLTMPKSLAAHALYVPHASQQSQNKQTNIYILYICPPKNSSSEKSRTKPLADNGQLAVSNANR